jgi:lipid-A-disaccharide synthase
VTSILIVAGENSGDKYGADLIRAYRRLDPTASFFGVGGKDMAEAGAEIIFPLNHLNIIGVTEAVLSWRRVLKMLRRLTQEARDRQVRAAVLIDSPDFNLRLAPRLHQEGVPVLYYISPTIWAWRQRRLEIIRRSVTKMLLIFPFEKEIYDSHQIPAVYVGHPLLERIKVKMERNAWRQKYNLPLAEPLITLLPGSRPSEIRYHLPILIKSMDIIRNKAKANFLLLKAETIDTDFIHKFIPKESPLQVLDQDKYEAMAASDLSLAACGTANMEACLLGTPLIAFYKLSPLVFYLGRNLVKIKHYSIVNILAGKQVIPELIQSRLTPANIAKEALMLLASPEKTAAMKKEFNRLRQLLGEERAPLKAALELYNLVNPPPGG